MTYPQRVVQFVSRFCAGTAVQRKDARYQLVMQIRGIDLRWNSVADLGLDEKLSESHGNSGGPALEEVLKTFNISSDDSILDIGAGKGGAMITLAKWPFRRIDGIELCPNLIRIAEHNLGRLGRVKGKITQCDAAEFQDLDSYTYFYMYNPFHAPIIKSVLHNINASLARRPRRATLIYKNPVYHDLIVEAGFRQTAHFTHTLPDFRVYQQ